MASILWALSCIFRIVTDAVFIACDVSERGVIDDTGDSDRAGLAYTWIITCFTISTITGTSCPLYTWQKITSLNSIFLQQNGIWFPPYTPFLVDDVSSAPIDDVSIGHLVSIIVDQLPCLGTIHVPKLDEIIFNDDQANTNHTTVLYSSASCASNLLHSLI